MPFPAVNPSIARALAEHQYLEPTPVQRAVLEADAAERDLLVSAQTGSGKTVAYGLAMASTLLGDAERLPQAAAPLALIIAPTRELALQVHTELTWLYGPAGARIVTCVGGMDPRTEQRNMNAGCHIVVGTPGRLKDHLERGNLDTSALKVIVLDEADEMLDLGFREDLEFILDSAPGERRTLLFSATIAKDIATLARKFQNDAIRIDTISRDEPHGDIEYRAILVAPNDVQNAIVNLLRFYEAGSALVFCSTRESVKRFHSALLERGFSAVALSGELSQNERTHALQSLRDGRARVCVATDVAARGLDLPDLGLVIHAEIPVNKAALLHRSGRTGRAGRKGVSVLLTPFTRRRRVEQLLDSASIEAQWAPPPSADEIRAKDQERMLNDPVLVEEATEEDRALGRILLEGRSAEDIAAALIRLHRSRMPAPEEMFDSRAFDEQPKWQRDRDVPREPRGPQDVRWFKMNVGRRKNADPKWILPLICRLGHVTKAEIGLIKILDAETRFGIAEAHADKFAAASAEVVEKDIRIEAADGPGPAYERSSSPRPERSERPRPPRPARSFDDRPRPERTFDDKPTERPERAARPDRADGPKKPAWVRGETAAEAPAREERRPYSRDERLGSGPPPRGDKPAFAKKPYEKAPYEKKGARKGNDTDSKPWSPPTDGFSAPEAKPFTPNPKNKGKPKGKFASQPKPQTSWSPGSPDTRSAAPAGPGAKKPRWDQDKRDSAKGKPPFKGPPRQK